MDFSFMTPAGISQPMDAVIRPVRPEVAPDASRHTSPPRRQNHLRTRAQPDEVAQKKAQRQQVMRDQDRERAMVKGAVYRSGLAAAMQEQIALADAEQKQQAEAELHRLSDVYERRVGRIGEAHVDAVVYMQQQEAMRAAQESRVAELNDLQAQRFQSALSALKEQHDIAKAQTHQQQHRRAQILKAERQKAQAFTADQAEREQARKKRQSELARQELERRKRSTNGLAVDFRHTRLHEGSATPGAVAAPAVIAVPVPAVPDPVQSAEELQHRAALEKRRREAAAAEAEFRARERFLAAQAKLRADAQKQAVQAELAELAAQRLQAKKQALAAHRLRLQDQRKQQDLQRVFEENFLSDGAAQEDDLAPRALPAFLQPAAAGARAGDPRSPYAPVPVVAVAPVATTAAAAPPEGAVPRWSKGRTAPLGRQPTSTISAPPHSAPSHPARGEIAVQPEPELLPRSDDWPQPSPQPLSRSQQADTSPERRHSTMRHPTPVTPGGSSVAGRLPAASGDPARRLAWPEAEVESRPSEPTTSASAPTAVTSSQGEVPVERLAQPQRRVCIREREDAQTEELELGGDGGDAADAWGEAEVDRELERMKRELGIEDSDLRSSVSSINSSISVPTFLGEAASRTAARQAQKEADARMAGGTLAAQKRPDAPAAVLGARQPANQAPDLDGQQPSKPSRPASGPSPQQHEQPEAPRRAPARPPSPDTSRTVPAQPKQAGARATVVSPAASRQATPQAHAAGSAAAPSPADTLDSSILRLLNSPSSLGTSQAATPKPAAALSGSRRPAGGTAANCAAAVSALGLTPGAASLPSDLDDVLLLTELDWDELEGLAGLRDTVERSGPGGGGATRAVAGATSGLGSSPGASSLSSVSGVSDESVRRLVEQGLLPPEIAMLLAATPTSAAATASLTAMTETGSAFPTARSAMSGAPASSPYTSSSLSGLTALLGARAGPGAGPGSMRAPDPVSSLDSLSTYAASLGVGAGRVQTGPLGPVTAATRTGPSQSAAAAAAARHGSPQKGLLTIPEGAAFAQPWPSSESLSPSSTDPAPTASPSSLASPLPDLRNAARPLGTQAYELAAAASGLRAPQAPALSEPIRLTLADLNRSLLSAGGVGAGASTAAAGAPAWRQPAPVRPARPGPMLIASLDPPPLTQPMQPPSALQPPRLQQLLGLRPQLGQGILGWTAPDLSATTSSSSLSLSPPQTSSTPAALGPASTPYATHQDLLSTPAVAVSTDTSSSLISLNNSDIVARLQGPRRPAPDPNGPNAPGNTRAAAGAGKGDNPYDIYDREQARLAELMASISASLKQSAEAVSRAGAQPERPILPLSSSPTASIPQPSARGGQGATSPAFDFASISLTSSSLSSLAFQASQPLLPYGVQSPVAALLASARSTPVSSRSTNGSPSMAAPSTGRTGKRRAPPAGPPVTTRPGASSPAVTPPKPPGRGPVASRADATAANAPALPLSSTLTSLSSLVPSTTPPRHASGRPSAASAVPVGGKHGASAAAISPSSLSSLSAAGDASSVLSLSTVRGLLQQHSRPSRPGAAQPPALTPGSVAWMGPVTVPLSRLAPPASPPPSTVPMIVGASPSLSMPSPPTPWSPVLSESSGYSSTPMSSNLSPGVPGAQPAPNKPAAAHRLATDIDSSSLSSLPQLGAVARSDVLSSSDALSSVAEAIASVIAQRAAAARVTQSPRQQQLASRPQVPTQQPQAQASARDAASSDISSSVGLGSTANVWASLTGQTLEEALAGLVTPEGRYDDLMRASLALSVSSLDTSALGESVRTLTLLRSDVQGTDELDSGETAEREEQEPRGPGQQEPADAPAPAETPSRPRSRRKGRRPAEPDELVHGGAGEGLNAEGPESGLPWQPAGIGSGAGAETVESGAAHAGSQQRGVGLEESPENRPGSAQAPASEGLMVRVSAALEPLPMPPQQQQPARLPVAGADPAMRSELELRISADSDEVASMMTGLLADIQRGLSALRAPLPDLGEPGELLAPQEQQQLGGESLPGLQGQPGTLLLGQETLGQAADPGAPRLERTLEMLDQGFKLERCGRREEKEEQEPARQRSTTASSVVSDASSAEPAQGRSAALGAAHDELPRLRSTTSSSSNGSGGELVPSRRVREGRQDASTILKDSPKRARTQEPTDSDERPLMTLEAFPGERRIVQPASFRVEESEDLNAHSEAYLARLLLAAQSDPAWQGPLLDDGATDPAGAGDVAGAFATRPSAAAADEVPSAPAAEDSGDDSDVVWWPERPAVVSWQPEAGLEDRGEGEQQLGVEQEEESKLNALVRIDRTRVGTSKEEEEGVQGGQGSAQATSHRPVLLSLPSFSRGFADAPGQSPPSPHSPREGGPGLWYGPEGTGQRIRAGSRNSSVASLVLASAGSEPADAPLTAGAPPDAVSAVAGATSEGARNGGGSSSGGGTAGLGSPGAAEAGAYSFSQPPRASLTRVRMPPSVHSGADSPSHPSSGSTSSPSVSTVSSLDSFTAALADYPIFGGAAESPMGSPSGTDSSADGAAGEDRPVGHTTERADNADSQASEILPIQYTPLQPAPLRSQPEANVEPWQGAWDPPSPLTAGWPGPSHGDAFTIAMQNLRITSSAPPGWPASPPTSASGEAPAQDRAVAKTAPREDGATLQPASAATGIVSLEHLLLSPELEPQPRDRELASEPHLGLSLRRAAHGAAPPALTIPADDSLPRAVVNLTARGSRSPLSAAAGDMEGGTAVVASQQGGQASPPRRLVIPARSSADEFTGFSPRGPQDVVRRRSSSGGGSASGLHGGGQYAGALSEEQLANLLMWTVSDFFSSPGSGISADAD